MKVSDFIVQFLIDKGVTDVFGYPGGSVTNLMDSLRKRTDSIRAHVVYHEQSAAFAACGYAATSGRIGMAYSTGGPGCTNLVTGIGHAYCDSIPVIFLTGNVNTYESKGERNIRQRGFQESDNVSVVKPVTKFSAYVENPEDIKYYLEKAYDIAVSGRKGPVLLDLPMDVQRAQIDPERIRGYMTPEKIVYDSPEIFRENVLGLLKEAKAPCLILGNGVKGKNTRGLAKNILQKLGIPYVTSMIAFDVLGSHPNYFGFLGAYGTRAANFIVAKSDLLIAVGTRLDIRQVGAKRENFAPGAKIVRVDLDREELKYKVHSDEMDFCMEAEEALKVLEKIECPKDYSHWMKICMEIRGELDGLDGGYPNRVIEETSRLIPGNTVISTDVGQNQVWVAQSFSLKEEQEVLFSGGFGAMGHALPAAIGAFYGSGGKNIVCICGDGGLQMNIQELQYVARENLPIKIIVFNNNALGMIRHFQEMYFEKEYYQTKPSGGYISPDFAQIADAYGIKSMVIESLEEISQCGEAFAGTEPVLMEIRYYEDTYIVPKLEFGRPNQDQDPKLDRKLYEKLMGME